MYDDIFLPTDGSAGTGAVVEHVCSLADRYDATVHVRYVVDQRHYMAAPAETKAEIRQSLEEEAERAVDELEVTLADAGVDVETAIADGVPHREIVAAASGDIDLIVMGTHGKTGREQVDSLGSTTERVVKNSDVPVLVVNIGTE